MEHTTTCTIGPLATTGERCGKPAVFVGAGFAECEAHHVALTPAAAAATPKAPRYCRKVACVEEAMGYEFVYHLAGTCGIK